MTECLYSTSVKPQMRLHNYIMIVCDVRCSCVLKATCCQDHCCPAGFRCPCSRNLESQDDRPPANDTVDTATIQPPADDTVDITTIKLSNFSSTTAAGTTG